MFVQNPFQLFRMKITFSVVSRTFFGTYLFVLPWINVDRLERPDDRIFARRHKAPRNYGVPVRRVDERNRDGGRSCARGVSRPACGKTGSGRERRSRRVWSIWPAERSSSGEGFRSGFAGWAGRATRFSLFVSCTKRIVSAVRVRRKTSRVPSPHKSHSNDDEIWKSRIVLNRTESTYRFARRARLKTTYLGRVIVVVFVIVHYRSGLSRSHSGNTRLSGGPVLRGPFTIGQPTAGRRPKTVSAESS